MAISRTAWIDDDGTGTTGTVINNAEKTLLYDQIDAALAPLPPSYLTGAWTPTDASGAGLALTGAGRYIRIGNLVMIQANVNFPATASTANVNIGALPFPCSSTATGGFYQTYGIQNIWYIDSTQSGLRLYSTTAVTARRNVDVSGAQMAFAGVYYTP